MFAPIPPAYTMPGTSPFIDGDPLLLSDALPEPIADVLVSALDANLDEGEIRAMAVKRALNIGSWLSGLDRRWPAKVIFAA